MYFKTYNKLFHLKKTCETQTLNLQIIKAPAGFEPAKEGFAGPSIRPLWHGAMG